MRTYTITYAGLGFDVRVARVDDGDLVTVYLAGARLSRTELAEYDASVDDVARSLAAGIAQDFKRASKVESAETEMDEAIVRQHIRLYAPCRICGEQKRRDSSCECQLTEAEHYYGVQ
jgi:hypothetical protein